MKNNIEIVNLKCGGCANSIKKGLLNIEGVSEVSVELETSKVTVEVANEEILSAAPVVKVEA